MDQDRRTFLKTTALAGAAAAAGAGAIADADTIAGAGHRRDRFDGDAEEFRVRHAGP